MIQRLIKIYKNARNILIPELCFSCGRKIAGEMLCSACREKIEFLYPPRCRFCAKPVNDNTTGLCRKCRGKQYPYDRLVCAAAYKEPLAGLIHLLKYKDYDYLGDFLGALLAEHLSRINFSGGGYDFIIGVPLHPLKLKERGFNQTSFLAKKIANHFKIEFKDDIIYGVKDKLSQTKLSGQDRLANIHGTFAVPGGLTGKQIILVDDIFTTGATIRECAFALKEKGAKTVTAITLAKT
jgi:ComF family protein